MRLNGKVALITGAASGMGAATAKLFAREGARIVVGDVLEVEGQKIAAEINAEGGDAVFHKLDISSESDWRSVVATKPLPGERIDILVNNAGISGSDPDLLSRSVWDAQMSVNATGTFLGMRTVIPLMQKAGGGVIVNLSSISGVVGQTFVHMGYNAAKGAVRTMTKAAAVQFAEDGIRVNSVHPGLMPAMRTSKLTADPEVRGRMLKAVPMRRIGDVDEVANAILFLASDEASYITGVELPVDGGYLAQ
ncbi:MAG TPA: glucose 1-dehydrogenase [Hyphomicrobiaceae bacterium]|nr:glucose 1-dehydrogenase [Hyphomicrobiaceae bacterium]